MIDKEKFLTDLDSLLKEVIEETGDADARQSAMNVRRTVVICAAGMDEEFEALVGGSDGLFMRAASECISDEFPGAANAEQS